jgi:peptidoglycan/xylan/chitin deacetylase (PgdA/CDA1 family)
VSSATIAAPLILPARLNLLAELGIHHVVGPRSPLRWPGRHELAGFSPRWQDIDGIPVYARTLPGGIRREAGVITLPFDPDEAVHNLRSEAYVRSGARALARRAYYRARPLLPRPVQLAARRAFTRVQSRSTFPQWPVETALHDLVALVLRLVEEATGSPVEPAPAWPEPATWAFVLTHDVETAAGVANIDVVRALEERRGLRSSWNLVPERYALADRLPTGLRSSGHEVGVHGLRHDGRDLASRRVMRRRLPAIRAAADRWGAVGFRAPATQRRFEWMPELGFEYDSSYPDTDPYEPQAGGCCSWLPFFNGDLVELPITVPQDHTVFEILRLEHETTWVEKIDLLRARGGMALVLTHPDYLLPGSRALTAYERVLDRYADDATAWHALPREVAAWWRRRAAGATS